jgi:putative DNA primase/helicase
MTDPIDFEWSPSDDDDPRAPPKGGGKLTLVGFRCTDLGNAERFVARNRGDVRYCFARNNWVIWTGKRWTWDPGGMVNGLARQAVRAIYQEAHDNPDPDSRKALAKHAHMSEKASAIASMLVLARSEVGIPIELSELDSDPMLLNCENGTINLATGTLHPHRQSDMITKMCPVRFDPKKRHEVWDRFLHEATAGDVELQAYIQRAIGYALQGKASERAVFFVYGAPGSAKSTLIDAFASALGDYHVGSSRETWLVQKGNGGNRGDLVRLAGSRLVTATEFRRGDRFDEGLIKAVTGGDIIVHAAKFEKDVEIRPTFALWFAANAAPVIRDDDAGTWARMRRIPFDHAIPEDKQDKAIKITLCDDPEARAAVLAWAVAGCALWQSGGLGKAKAVTESNKQYRAEMDPIGGFFELLKFSAELQMTASAFRKSYRTWCDDNGVKFMLERSEIEKRLHPHGARYATIHGKQWVKGCDMIGEWEEPDQYHLGYQGGGG